MTNFGKVAKGRGRIFSCKHHCVFDKPPPIKLFGREGIFNVVAGIGTLQVAKALKYFLGVGEFLKNCLLTFDALKSEFRRVKISQNKNCKACREVNSC